MLSYFFRFSNERKYPALELKTINFPCPKENEILIKVKAAGLNRGELNKEYNFSNVNSVVAAGVEAAGIVVDVAPSVKNIKIGDAVMGRCKGAFSEYALMHVSDALLAPKNLSWVEAAAIPLNFLVAYDSLLVQYMLRKDDYLLILGASSGVGVAAIQLGRALGANIIGTTRSKEKIGKLKKIGVEQVLRSEEGRVGKECR